MTAHARLDLLRQQAAAERVKQRELEAQIDTAKAKVESASAAITEAYASEDNRLVAKQRKGLEVAEAELLDLQHRLDAAGLRIERAQAEVDTYLVEHARDLLDEREVEAREVAEALTRAGYEAVRLHRAYRGLRSEIDKLVAAVPGASPRADGPEQSHPWEQQLNDLARGIQETPEVPPPLPRWAGLAHRQQQDQANRIEQQRRRGELSPDTQAALALGRTVK